MKKIITSIILSCVLCFPMMVDARRAYVEEEDAYCTVYDKYYFIQEAPQSNDQTNSNVTITRENGKFNATSHYTAYFDNTIGNDEILEEEILYTSSDLESYNSIWFSAIRNAIGYGKSEYTSNGSKYYLQSKFEANTQTYDGLPFFTQYYAGWTETAKKQTFESVVEDSYFYLSREYSNKSVSNCSNCIYVNSTIDGNNDIELDVYKNFSIPYTVSSGTDGSAWNVFYNSPWVNFSGYETNQLYSFRIVPAVYKITHYNPDNCYVEEETKYTITYDPNGGTGEIMPYTVKVTEGDSHSVIDNNNATKYTRKDYSFRGWSTDENATSATYETGDSFTPTSNMTLYAIWQKIDENAPTHTVTYYKNAGNNEETKNSDPITHGESYKIMSGDIYTREGYKFLGWSTDKDATEADTTYNPDSIIPVDKDLNLYAVWLKEGNKEEGEIEKHGLGYSIGLIGTILAGTGAGVVYFKKRNKFENI